jgi:hypothetical protein
VRVADRRAELSSRNRSTPGKRAPRPHQSLATGRSSRAAYWPRRISSTRFR